MRFHPLPPSCQGYFYVEAHKEAHVKEALKGLRMIYQSKPPKLVRGGSLSLGADRGPCLLGGLHWRDNMRCRNVSQLMHCRQ